MPMSRGAIALQSSNTRSAVSNGSRMLAGVDGRGAVARRYRDLVQTLSDEFGAEVSQADLLQIRNAASLQLHVEDLTGRIANGERIDPETLTRAANAATRANSALRRRKPSRQLSGQGALAEYLETRRGRQA